MASTGDGITPTDEEIRFLADAGNQFGYLMKLSHHSLNFCTFAMGLEAAMCICGIYLYLRLPDHIKQTRRTLLIVNAVLVALIIFDTSVTQARTGDSVLQDGGILGTMIVMDEHAKKGFSLMPDTLGGFANYFSNVIADGILVYRAYKLWLDYPWVSVLPSLGCLASAGMGVICVIQYFSPAIIDKHLGENSFVRNQAIWVTLSVGVSTSATTLIVFRLLIANRRLSKMMPGRDLTEYTSIMAIMIESALPFTVCGLITAILGFVPFTSGSEDPNDLSLSLTQSAYGATVLYPLANVFLTIGPQLIIFRVTAGKSRVHDMEVEATQAFSRPLDFAPGPRSEGASGDDLSDFVAADVELELRPSQDISYSDSVERNK